MSIHILDEEEEIAFNLFKRTKKQILIDSQSTFSYDDMPVYIKNKQTKKHALLYIEKNISIIYTVIIII